MASVPAVVPDVAGMPDAQAHIGRPVRAFTASNMADSANSLLMWRHLRMVQSTFMASDLIGEAAQWAAYRIRWVTSPSARYVWIGFFPFALEQRVGTGLAQEVKGEVRFTGGAQIDGDIFWRYTPAAPANPGHGRLPTIGTPDPLVSRAFAGTFAQTGWGTQIDTAYQGPRMLDLGSNQATDVEVVLTTQACRLYGAVVIEAFRPVVT